LAARNDEVKITSDTTAKPAAKADSTKDSAKKPAVKSLTIVPDGFEARVQVLAPAAGNYGLLKALEGKLVYARFPNTGTVGEQPALYLYDAEKREEKKIISGVSNFAISGDGK